MRLPLYAFVVHVSCLDWLKTLESGDENDSVVCS